MFRLLLCLLLLPRLLNSEFVSPVWEHFDAHSPTCIELTTHELLTVYYGGFGEGKCDYPAFTEEVGLWQTRLKNGVWSTPELIVSYPEAKCWNPVLHRLQSGELILFYKIGENPRAWYGVFRRSYDEGRTWGDEELLPAGILGPIRTKALTAPDGSLICGSSVEAAKRATACWIEIASPDLKTWAKYGPIEIPGKPFGALQPSLYYGQDGRLHLLCRDRSEMGYIRHAVSSDDGKTWSTLESTGLPNPDSGLDTESVGNRLLLVYNPSHEERFPLALAFSDDDGQSWSPWFNLETERAEYPYMIRSEDGLIHVVYSFSSRGECQRRIKHALISP